MLVTLAECCLLHTFSSWSYICPADSPRLFKDRIVCKDQIGSGGSADVFKVTLTDGPAIAMKVVRCVLKSTCLPGCVLNLDTSGHLSIGLAC